MNKSQAQRDTGIDRGTITRYFTKGVKPHHDHEVTFTALAVEHAKRHLAELGLVVGTSDEEALFRYLELRENGSKGTSPHQT